jgi:hypothetical protein
MANRSPIAGAQEEAENAVGAFVTALMTRRSNGRRPRRSAWRVGRLRDPRGGIALRSVCVEPKRVAVTPHPSRARGTVTRARPRERRFVRRSARTRAGPADDAGPAPASPEPRPAVAWVVGR